MEVIGARAETRGVRRPSAKRIFDFAMASSGLIVASPVLAAAAIAVKLTSTGPVFFRQERIGRAGKPFKLWKFRTMVAGAERGGLLTIGRDSRVTPVGRWLRRSKIDELPQLINVIMGDMSLVGPRPEVARYVAHYSAAQRMVLSLTPGMTDPASIRFSNESALLETAPDPELMYLRDQLPEKIRLSLEYAAKATLWTDVVMILRTFAVILVTPAMTPRGRESH